MIHRRPTFAFLALMLTPAAWGTADKAYEYQPVAPARPLDATQVHARIREILEDQRGKQHIPGLAFVAVQDDKVLFFETLGLRDVARKLPVTAETVFPIGSCTKSFTAIAAGISHDRGTLSIDDSPHKYLPWFRMADPEANTLVTLRDMLSHRTGLRAYADLAAEPAVLTREEFLRAATAAKPTAKFRAAFQYSNAMFTAAGEAIAKANQTTWEGLIESTILHPLGMTSSRTSTDDGVKMLDHAVGYVYEESSKDWKEVAAPKSLVALAPAGSVVSSARDLGHWLRFLTSGGTIDGKRILSEDALREITRPHVDAREEMSYGLGWVIFRWNGHTVVEHNGGSEGICALVSFVPDRRVGFALVGNTSPGQLMAIGKAGQLLWPLLLGETDARARGTSSSPAGAPPVSKPTSNPPAANGLPSVDDLFARIIAAYGGERNLRGHHSVEIHARKVYENQGVEADLVIRSSEPAKRSEVEDWKAVGKPIGSLRSYFDGTRGGHETTFGQGATYTGDELEQTRRKSALHAILDARSLYSQVSVDRKETLAGEETFVIKLTPKSGPSVALFVSSRTSLILQEQTEGETLIFGDHRNIDGEVVPFRTTGHDALGETTIDVKDVRFNMAVSPHAFGPRKPAVVK